MKTLHPVVSFVVYAANAIFVSWLAGYDFNRRGRDVALVYVIDLAIAGFFAFIVNRRGREWFGENFFRG